MTLNLSGAATASAATDAGGNFSFANLAIGDYVATPALTGYTFNPTSTVVSVIGANISGTNFTATANVAPTYTLSGTVTAAGTGAVLQNVLITLSGAGSATTLTNASGGYSFSGLTDGSYTVTPAPAGYTFSPASTTVPISGASVVSANFTATGIAATGRLNDTGSTANQCYQAGDSVLVACNSVGATTLNSAQDGMVGRDADVATNNNADGNLGFSFTAVTGGCVQDNVTGLMWEVKTADGGLRDWTHIYTNYDSTTTAQKVDGTTPTQAEIDAATNSIGFKNAVNSQALCGFSDWRLPTVDELHSIVDYGVVAPGPTVDATWLPNTQGGPNAQGNTLGGVFWSASPYVGNSASAWVVYFNNGFVDFNGRHLNEGRNMRLVRASQSAASAQRYVISTDGTEVTDQKTGLIWRRCSEGMVFSGDPGTGNCTVTASTFTHEAALARAQTEAANTGIAWRLPNIKELASIADKSLSNPAIDRTVFPATPAKYFWSASPYVRDSFGSWDVSFDVGRVSSSYSDGRTIHGYVRLVRDGQ